ncbi:MAG: coenzyme F420-0:L-glutamate ligase [Hadesarchaea archaeon]|nr:coenzyme F420-0:L-glutamate ligase [Hadesarchaea archaeon]
MRVLGLNMPLIKPGDDLSAMIARATEQVGGLRDEDIIVISSKVVATVQGRVRELARVRPSARAKKIAAKSGQDPEFVELVLREAGSVLNISKNVILTLKSGVICANAGVDNSNVPPGHVVLMPTNPNRVARELQRAIEQRTNARVGVIITDSNVKPLRLGTVGQAIGVTGLEPVVDCRGQHDLYGKPLRITFRALADQLATAAQAVMGEAAEGVPVVVVRGAGVEFVEKPKRSPKISPKQCIYFNGLKLSKKS